MERIYWCFLKRSSCSTSLYHSAPCYGWYDHQPANRNISSISSMNHSPLYVYVYPSKLPLQWLVSWSSKASRLFQSGFSLSWTMLSIVYKLEQGFAWRSRGGCRLGRVNYVATGTKYCFIYTCTQSKKTKNGKNTTHEAILGGIYWKLWMTMQLPVFL